MTFSEALEQLKLGKKLKRKNWNGKNQFIIQIDRDLLENILRGGTDEKWGDRPWKENSFLNSLETTRFNVTDLLAIKTTANQLQLGWLASQTDMLSDDWEVIDNSLKEVKTEDSAIGSDNAAASAINNPVKHAIHNSFMPGA